MSGRSPARGPDAPARSHGASPVRGLPRGLRGVPGGAPSGAVAMARVAAVRYAAFAADIADWRSDSCKMDDLEFMLSGDLSGERLVVFLVLQARGGVRGPTPGGPTGRW